MNSLGDIELSSIPSITLETKCWENDWEFILKTSHFEKLISRNSYNFKNKILMINNFKNYLKVIKYADKLINEGILTKYYIVEEYAKEALDFFNLKKKDFNSGYFYSISELVSIYLSETDYILHFSSDSMIQEKSNWISDSLIEFNKDENIKVSNLLWNDNYNEAKIESFKNNNNFFWGYGFSDQCYLIKTNDFKKRIYSEKNIKSNRYPKHGGCSFEKRVDSWMRNNNFHRITYKHSSYLHKNYPKDFIKKKKLLMKNILGF